jgi:predicted ArsR family transcriptional regulator
MVISHDDVLAAVQRVQPATVREVLNQLGVEWSQRGTVRNRLYDLVDQGLVVTDYNRPARFARSEVS